MLSRVLGLLRTGVEATQIRGRAFLFTVNVGGCLVRSVVVDLLIAVSELVLRKLFERGLLVDTLALL